MDDIASTILDIVVICFLALIGYALMFDVGNYVKNKWQQFKDGRHE